MIPTSLRETKPASSDGQASGPRRGYKELPLRVSKVTNVHFEIKKSKEGFKSRSLSKMITNLLITNWWYPICSKIVENTAVYNIFQNSLDNADVVITDGESKDLLYALLKLFVRVRSFNFAKDIVQATKLKNVAERNSKKALRQNLKAAEDLDNIGVWKCSWKLQHTNEIN